MTARRLTVLAACGVTAVLLTGCGTPDPGATADRPDAPMSAPSTAASTPPASDPADPSASPMSASPSGDPILRLTVLSAIPDAFDAEWAILTDSQRVNACDEWKADPAFSTDAYRTGLTSAGTSMSDLEAMGITQQDVDTEIVIWMNNTCRTTVPLP